MSSRIYCIAQFRPKAGRHDELFAALQSLESNTRREDGCIQYIVTRHIPSPFAGGQSFPIVFHEIFADNAAFEAHCRRKEIKQFFATHCESPGGAAEAVNICVYSDEPINYDAPKPTKQDRI